MHIPEDAKVSIKLRINIKKGRLLMFNKKMTVIADQGLQLHSGLLRKLCFASNSRNGHNTHKLLLNKYESCCK